MATSVTMTRVAKCEGTIANVFASLTAEAQTVLPDLFIDLKNELWNDALFDSWREVLKALEHAVDEVASKGSDIIPRVSYNDILKGLPQDKVNEIKRIGAVVIKGAVPQEKALQWKQSIRDYAKANANLVKGFPSDNIQVFEIYNSKAQTEARTHPGIVNTQKFLLSLWHKSDPSTEVSLETPIAYFDRLRIRQPGDVTFTLGPHTDGGSVEQWEDKGLQKVYANILKGGSNWKKHDSFDVTPRIGVKHTSYGSSIFRAWQGWTSLSITGPNEGTLQVLPMLSLASAYIILRPFFRPRDPLSTSLAFDDWVLDLHTPTFPGSTIGKTQELNEKTHPHLQLSRTMVSVPKVEPGDQVYWHCDAVHAVESQHNGLGDSSVLYIPAVPLTIHNVTYLREQRINFLAGLPPLDFPGGEGESKFVGRASAEDISTDQGRLMYGLAPFAADESNGLSSSFVEKVNCVLV